MNAEQKKNKDRIAVSYILNAVGFIGFVGGLHRLYNGKIGTGLLWLCTGGLLGVGQFIDLFLIPSMVDEHEMRLRLKAGLSPMGVPLTESTYTSQVYKPSTQNKLIAKLIEAAEARGGALTVTQGVKATGASFSEVEAVFKEMLKAGYVRIDNDPTTGAVTYHFHEL
ncbi:NINE protein [Aetokthonos hydrillicola Thurmond2011]|jgi:TM2 domain-containing membrane protein YozV|uniref:NINE protein n=1 Tax=Aetokthonos hydrillicola Thurmond2011 TaxID=2712845 RepID=A0AAP5I8K7_9CYAN|nr:NINE protein [Aetokthonos hydrillicola]MBO3458927.1 NINE protein [Aetokthonos hydrillicola CCALA 1050]MBW4587222.1 NINE protein [Aetokthonos hydrillicola CCALA 1050]MDR9896755.1 NINE protein [Aetokthonos hydrillicola Thurmond2011]